MIRWRPHKEDFRLHKHEKIFVGGKENKKYPARQCELCDACKK
jgi:hypothetical protein